MTEIPLHGFPDRKLYFSLYETIGDVTDFLLEQDCPSDIVVNPDGMIFVQIYLDKRE